MVSKDDGWILDTSGAKTNTHGFRESTTSGFDEVVAVFEDNNALYLPDPQGNPDRQMVVGKTRQGRMLQAIFTYEDAPLVRIITAFDASAEWKDEYVR